MSWCGGGADEADAGRRVPGLGDPRVHLVTGQLATLAGLGALRHLDLDVVGVDQVLAGDAEPARGHLLDRRALRIAVGKGLEALRILATLTGVGLRTEAVHGDRQRLVRLLADRAVGHRTRGEPLDDLADGLHLVERDRLALPLGEPEHPTQGHQPLGLVVDPRGVLAEDVDAPGSRRVLQPEHGLRVEQVRLALTAPLVLAADRQGAVRRRDPAGRVGHRVPTGHLLGDHVEPDAAEPGRRAGEVLVDQRVAQADRLEDLRAAVGGDSGHPHLAHHLQHALAQRLHQVAHRLLRGDPGDDRAAGPGPPRTPWPGRG